MERMCVLCFFCLGFFCLFVCEVFLLRFFFFFGSGKSVSLKKQLPGRAKTSRSLRGGLQGL